MPEIEPHPDFEVFSDPCYYDMWAVRPKGERDFDRTAHFPSYEMAAAVSHYAAMWIEAALNPSPAA